MTCWDLHPPEDVPAGPGSEGNRAAPKDWSGTRRHRRKDGTLITVETISHTLDFAGRLARFVLAHNVTRQAEAEGALRRSEAHFRTLVENTSDIVCLLDAQLTVQYASPSVETLLGYKPAELLGRSSLELLHPDSKPLALQHAAEALKNPGVVSPLLELEVRHQDGSGRHLAATGVCPCDDSPAKTILLTLHDITERQRTEEHLRESEDRYRRLFELCPD